MSKQLCFEVNGSSPGRRKNKDRARKLKQPVINNQNLQKERDRQAVSWELSDQTKDCKLKTLSLRQKKEKFFDSQIHKRMATTDVYNRLAGVGVKGSTNKFSYGLHFQSFPHNLVIPFVRKRK